MWIRLSMECKSWLRQHNPQFDSLEREMSWLRVRRSAVTLAAAPGSETRMRLIDVRIAPRMAHWRADLRRRGSAAPANW